MFMRLLFDAGDSVALVHLDASGIWSNAVLTLDDAIAHLLANASTPNLTSGRPPMTAAGTTAPATA